MMPLRCFPYLSSQSIVLVALIDRTNIWLCPVDGVQRRLLLEKLNKLCMVTKVEAIHLHNIQMMHSGRAPTEIVHQVLSVLELWIADKRCLQRVVVVGEQGGIWAINVFDATWRTIADLFLVVPFILSSAIREVLDDPDFADVLALESGKRTMMRIIKQPISTRERFQERQRRFTSLVQCLLESLQLQETWKIDTTSDAIEITPMHADAGNENTHLVCWRRKRELQPQSMIVTEKSALASSLAEVVHSMGMFGEQVTVDPAHTRCPTAPGPGVFSQRAQRGSTLSHDPYEEVPWR